MLGLFSSLWAQDSLNMRLLYQWQDSTIPAAPWIGNVYNEIWGWHDTLNNREYAIIGTSIGTHIFDVTEVDNGQADLVAYIPGKDDRMIHRDYKHKDQYLYAVSDEGNGNLQIIDMSYLPDSAPVVQVVDTFFMMSHNIWIDGDIMYAAIPRGIIRNSAHLGLYDLSDPLNPVILGLYNQFGVIHDLYVRNDTAYLNASNDGLRIVDFSDPLNPVLLADLDQYPYKGYNHSGWLSDDGQHYYFADENHGRPLKTLDVTDLDNLELRSFPHPDIATDSIYPEKIAHNPVAKGRFLFCSYYYDGVYIFDMARPDSPVIAGFYDTFTGAHNGGYEGNWGVYPFLPSGHILVSDMQSGLYVFEFNPDTVVTMPPDSGTTAINSPSWEDGVFLSPNPLKDHTLIQNLPQGPVSYAMFDRMGRLVAEGSGHVLADGAYTIKPQAPKGLYTLLIKTRKGRLARSILISP